MCDSEAAVCGNRLHPPGVARVPDAYYLAWLGTLTAWWTAMEGVGGDVIQAQRGLSR
jgi:hypothetical protein